MLILRLFLTALLVPVIVTVTPPTPAPPAALPVAYTDALAALAGALDDVIPVRRVPPQAATLVLTQKGQTIVIQLTPQLPVNLPQSPMLAEHFTLATASDASTLRELLSATALYAQGRCDDSESLLERAQISNNATLLMRGVCALHREDYEAAPAYFEASGLPAAMTNLAWLAYRDGRITEAFRLADGQIAAAMRTNNPEPRAEAYRARAHLHALNFDYDSALADVDSALAALPDDPGLFVLRGQLRLLLYEWDAVLEDYNRALALDPNYAEAYFYRGVLLYTIAGTGSSDVNALRRDATRDFERYLALETHGQHTEDAARYISQIEAELNALED